MPVRPVFRLTKGISVLFWAVLTLATFSLAEALATEECPMISTLTVKDTQDGFAGQIGTVWTISPNCSFTVSRQIGPQITSPHREGRLTQHQWARLGGLLSRLEQLNLPKQFGPGPRVNARRIIFLYGEKQATLLLPPGAPPPDLDAFEPAWRLLELASAVREALGE